MSTFKCWHFHLCYLVLQVTWTELISKRLLKRKEYQNPILYERLYLQYFSFKIQMTLALHVSFHMKTWSQLHVGEGIGKLLPSSSWCYLFLYFIFHDNNQGSWIKLHRFDSVLKKLIINFDVKLWQYSWGFGFDWRLIAQKKK